MAQISLYCDGSFSPQSKVGVGAVLHLSDGEWKTGTDGSALAIRTKILPASSIARIELMAALWGLSEPGLSQGVHLFTDCKMIEDLPMRRAKLEGCNYRSGRTGLALANADLYAQFFKVFDSVQPKITRVRGHAPKSGHTEHQRIFSFVDKRAREVLREHLRALKAG